MEINKKDKFTLYILMGHQLIQWAFPANRYLSARWINAFSESSEKFVGPLRRIQAISPQLHYLLIIMSCHSGLCPQVFPSASFHISILLLLTCETCLFLMELSVTFMNSSLHYFSCSVASLIMSSSFPWSVHTFKPEARSCHLPACLNRSHPRQAHSRHPEEQTNCILVMGLQQEPGGGNLSFSLFSWPLSAERKRIFQLFLVNFKLLS